MAQRPLAVNLSRHARLRDLLRDLGQPAFYRWTPRTLTVVSTDTNEEPVHAFTVAVNIVPGRLCPMRAVKNAPQEPYVCRNPGGPWISSSIHEAARWNHHRLTFLEALGRDVCNGGPACGPAGRAVPSRSRLVPSRYGPARHL